VRPDDLKSLTPRDAMQRFLDRRASDDTTSPETVASYEDRLKRFVRWCEDQGILNVNDLSGRHLDDYWQFRRESLNDVSLKNEFSTLKKMLEYLVAIEAVEPDMPDKAAMLKPTLSKKQRSNDRKLGSDRAEAILAYLEKFHYATRDHAMLLVLWHTGCRRGDLQSLDVEDFHEDDGYVEFRHRPAEGTRLKNEDDGERANALGTVLGTSVAEVIGDYVCETRIEQTDQHGRQPLFTTERVDATAETIREHYDRSDERDLMEHRRTEVEKLAF